MPPVALIVWAGAGFSRMPEDQRPGLSYTGGGGYSQAHPQSNSGRARKTEPPSDWHPKAQGFEGSCKEIIPRPAPTRSPDPVGKRTEIAFLASWGLDPAIHAERTEGFKFLRIPKVR